jgi:hypothetical protein
MEHFFRTLNHLLATATCPGHTAAAYDGHRVWRLVAGLVLLDTSRVLFKGRVTMEELIFSLKHHWRFLDAEVLEVHGLSWDIRPQAACVLASVM